MENNIKSVIPFRWLARYRSHPELNALLINAETGDSEAQCALGIRLIREYAEEAVYWFDRAARAGNADAQCWLAECYHNGRGVAADPDRAAELYRKAADGGDLVAIGRVASNLLYPPAPGVPDPEAALRLLLPACSSGKGSGFTYYLLGEAYRYGLGTRVDNAEALKWYRLSARNGDRDALLRLGYFYEQGIVVRKNIREAIRLYEAGQPPHGQGWIDGLNRIFYRGEWPVENEARALHWVRASAERGNVFDQLQMFLENADMFPAVSQEALDWLGKSATSGLLLAINLLEDHRWRSAQKHQHDYINIMVSPTDTLSSVIRSTKGHNVLWLRRGTHRISTTIDISDRHLQLRALHRSGTRVVIDRDAGFVLRQRGELSIDGIELRFEGDASKSPIRMQDNRCGLAVSYAQLTRAGQGEGLLQRPFVALQSPGGQVSLRESTVVGCFAQTATPRGKLTVTLQDSTFFGEKDVEALSLQDSTLQLQNCHFTGYNRAITVDADGDSMVTVTKSFFSKNGIAVVAANADVTVEQCSFSDVATPVAVYRCSLHYRDNTGYYGQYEIIVGPEPESWISGPGNPYRIDDTVPDYAIKRAADYREYERLQWQSLQVMSSSWQRQSRFQDNEKVVKVSHLRSRTKIESSGLQRLANEGDSEAQLALALQYLEGKGDSADTATATKWLAHLASRGDKVAAWHLGQCYRDGVGVAPDATQALELFRMADSANNAGAAFQIGSMLQSGAATGKADSAAALPWFQRAAAIGSHEAELAIYLLLRAGKEDPPTPEERAWLEKAAVGVIKARRMLEKLPPKKE